jgi:hypothetical protein
MLAILIIIGIIFTILLGRRIKEQQKVLKQLSCQNQEYELDNENLILQFNILQNENKKEQEKLELLLSEINSVAEVQRETAQKAFENYVDILDKAYENAEQEYNKSIDLLNVNYSNIQKEHQQKLERVMKEFNTISATRDAAIAAQLREKQIKEQRSFYCLNTKLTDISDVQTLERIKPQLNNPRVLSMLVWQTYFQKPMTTLCNNVLGIETVCGIYKITNQETNESYIGQSVDVSKRWKDHIKCGLGIDTPIGNKLYKAMQEYGVWNFSWELLEACSREELNAKEKFYINLYKTYEYGYNSNLGVGK